MLFVGDDWAEDHHDLAILDPEGRLLKQVRIPEGVDGITAFTETVAGCMPDDDGDPSEVLVCIEIDHGPWVQALQAAGYRVFGVDPKQAKRHRESVSSSGAKSDKSDARALADMVRTRRLQLRESGGDSELAESIKVVARAHQRAVWDLARHSNRMRAVLRLYFPVVLTIASELDVAFSSSVILGLLDKCAARPVKARKLTGPQVKSLLYRRREQDLKTARIRELLREEPLPQSEVMLQAYATTVLAEVAILRAIAGQVTVLEKELAGHFSQHPLAEIYLSQPGVGVTIGPRLLGEFGDLPDRYRSAKARRNA
ncbi:IS110 family transposase, partial [Gordonia desulfuricans]